MVYPVQQLLTRSYHLSGVVSRELETVSGGATDAPGEAPEQIAVADTQEPNKRTSEPLKGGKKRGRPRLR